MKICRCGCTEFEEEFEIRQLIALIQTGDGYTRKADCPDRGTARHGFTCTRCRAFYAQWSWMPDRKPAKVGGGERWIKQS
jgi:hypothetical protein